MYIVDESHPCPATPCVATIGFFDGVHRGHRYLLEQLSAEAERRGVESCVVTFDAHPRRALDAGFQPRLLTSLAEKLDLLAAAGVDRCCVLHFDRTLAALPARDFMQTYLKEKWHAAALLVGYDHHFGRGGDEGFVNYVRYGRELGIDVVRARSFQTADVRVSSSATRRFLEAGNVEMARLCLGRPYRLSGTVVEGRRVGRHLGFPTANVAPDCTDKLIPATGVYAVRAEADGKDYDAMVNIGDRPTFGDSGPLSVEAHLFGFSGDLYNHTLRLDFVRRLREERRFDSPEALRRQLEADAGEALRLLRS